MRVAEVAHFSLPHVGGIESYVHRVARDLLAAGIDCRVYSSSASSGKPGTGAVGPVPMTWLKSRNLLPRNPWLTGLEAALREARPDVVHVQSIWFLPSFQVGLYKRRLGYRVVNSIHGVLPDRASLAVRAFVQLFKPMAQWILDRSDLVIVYNELERAKLLAHFRVAPERIALASMGADACTPPPAADLRALSPYLLFTGRIIADKNPEVLLRAFAQAAAQWPALRLVFLGPIEPALQQRLLSLAPATLRPRVLFTGPLDPVREEERLAAWYANAELSVAIGSWEGLPTRILESLAQGTPLLAFPSGGSAQVVRDGFNAHLVHSLEPEELARAILRHQALSPEDRQSLRDRARASAQAHLWPARFAEIKAVLERAAGLP